VWQMLCALILGMAGGYAVHSMLAVMGWHLMGRWLDRAYDADETLTDATKRFIDRHIASGEKRPPAASARGGIDEVARKTRAQAEKREPPCKTRAFGADPRGVGGTGFAQHVDCSGAVISSDERHVPV
jgi:hypothetical protein